jgi:hypothetical protein
LLIAPASANNSRASTEEKTIYVLEATITDYKQEKTHKSKGKTIKGDDDYHIALKGEDGSTLIAEIPKPNCLLNTPEPLKSMITQARADFDAKFHVTGSFKTTNAKVRITGPALFDRAHGQRGLADNAVEIHPVIKIEFLD